MYAISKRLILIGAFAATSVLVVNVISEPQNYYPKTQDALIECLTSAKSGDSILLTSNITIDTFNLPVKEGVVLMGTFDWEKNRQGSTIVCRKPMKFGDAALVMQGSKPTVKNIRIIGQTSWGYNSDHSDVIGFNCAVRMNKTCTNGELSAFYISNFNTWGVWMEGTNNTTEHGIINYTMQAGFGYGVWGKSMNGGVNVINNVIISGAASAIDGGGHLSDLVVQDNTIYNPIMLKCIGLHGQGMADYGGMNMFIENNSLYSQALNISVPLPSKSDTTKAKVWIANNKTILPEITYRNGVPFSSWAEVARIFANKYSPNSLVHYQDNEFEYNESGYKQVFNTSKLEGVAPLVVSVNNQGSTSGFSIYKGGLGDHTGTVRFANSTAYTYPMAGRYLIEQIHVLPKTMTGLKPQRKAVIVRPNTAEPMLTGWVYDTYMGGLTNKAVVYVAINTYTNKVLTKSDTVWTSDIATFKGWQQLNVPIPSVNASNRISVGFILKENVTFAQMCELKVFIDDMYLFNTTVNITNGDAEIKGDTYKDGLLYYYRPTGSPTGISFQQNVEFARSGDYSLMLRLPYTEGSNLTWVKGMGGAVEFYLK
jgi:hypothetical protein